MTIQIADAVFVVEHVVELDRRQGGVRGRVAAGAVIIREQIRVVRMWQQAHQEFGGRIDAIRADHVQNAVALQPLAV